jgi:hypothetical protein
MDAHAFFLSFFPRVRNRLWHAGVVKFKKGKPTRREEVVWAGKKNWRN